MNPTEPTPAGTPAVGNILGFGLLLRDRRALLSLEGRSLADGVRVERYEAEIPDVSFPLDSPASPSAYRQRRCRATQLVLRFDLRTIRSWLSERLEHTSVGALAIERVTFEPRSRPIDGVDACPCLVVEGQGADGSFAWLLVAFQAAADGAAITLRPFRTWTFGGIEGDGPSIWASIATRLGPHCGRVAGEPGVVRIDPARLAMTRPLVTSGWKIPDLSALVVAELGADRHGLTVTLAADADPMPPQPSELPGDERDAVGELVARVRATAGSALDDQWLHAELERLTDLVAHHGRARLASLRWRAEITRFTDPEHCSRALHEWIELAPNDPIARKLLATRLAADGDARSLALMIAGACRLPNPPARQARLELALAGLLIDKLDDAVAASALLEPLVDRIRATPALDALLPETLTYLAHARAIGEAARPRAALDALEEAVRLTPAPARRAVLRARVARAFAAAGDTDRALRLMAKACEEDPGDNEYLDWAISLSRRAGQIEAAVELLTVRLERADELEVPAVRGRLIDLLGELDDPRFQARALGQIRVALDRSPDDRRLRRRAADIARSLGNPVEAADYVAGLIDGADQDQRLQLHIERAQLLERADPQAAISLLRDLVEQHADVDALLLELTRIIASVEGMDEPTRTRELLPLYEQLAANAPDDVDRLARVARLRTQLDPDAATEDWAAVLARLPDGDVRTIEPAMQLARGAIERNLLPEAAALLERVLAVEPTHDAALAALDGVATDLRDPALTIRVTAQLLATDVPDPRRADLLVRRALAHRDLGEPSFALADIAAATAAAAGTDQHGDLARLWLEMASADGAEDQLESQAAARAALRAAGADVDTAALRTEALLLDRLGRTADAVAVLDGALAAAPGDETLLTTLRELSTDSPEPIVGALERAAAAAGEDDPRRDRWLLELARIEIEAGREASAASALDRIESDAARSEDALALRREVAVALGRGADEVARVEAELLDHPRDRLLLSHLVELVERREAVEHVLALAAAHAPNPALELAESALELARREPADLSAAVAAAAALVEHGPSPTLIDALPLIGRLALDARRDDVIVELIDSARTAQFEELDVRAQRLLELAVVEMPDSVPLHAALARRMPDAGDDPATRHAAAGELLSGIVQRHGLAGERVARLHVGFAGGMDGRQAVRFLYVRALEYIGDEAAFEGFAAELARRELWLASARLLEAKIERTRDPAAVAGLLRRLATICVDKLDDRATAIVHLERARELSPNEPGILLPLLDYYYEQADLSNAVELTLSVLEHVKLGNAAYLALAHRGVDAAVAASDFEQAKAILTLSSQRLPDDGRTRERLAELTELERDPEHREKMLATIADRRSGTARLEALEERAKLLVDPLDRVGEAIQVLRTVIDEAPDRRVAIRVLGDIYAEQGSWAELVALLEDDAQRLQGRERSIVLGRIAAIYRDRLYDLPRAEHALWLAYESTGLEEEDVELLDRLRRELIACLEQQGRYEDLATFLDRELEGREQSEPESPTTIELLTVLARTYRGVLDDDVRAARLYERLEQRGHLPEEGLACLARWYRREHRYEDLVRVLRVRSEELERNDDRVRKAEVDHRIAELLEGPLRRPQDAARAYLQAYLADPETNTIAGARARLLLASTDSVANVRKRLLDQLPQLPHDRRPALLCLLGDLLAPHDEHEREAEAKYRQAVMLAPEFGAAHEGLGRLLARQGRLEAAIEPLTRAAQSESVPADRAAENAAIAARSLFELERTEDAERVLRDALVRAPESQRALLELARLHNRTGRRDAEADVLDQLSALRLSSMLRAEVTYRRAMLLEPEFSGEPMGETAELARGYLLAAVSADASHAAARQVLLDLATQRQEWGVVAHMRYLAIRELSPGPQRALVHLDLAQTYLDHLDDRESALRNIESALQQGFDDLLVVSRASRLAERLSDPADAAARMQAAAATGEDLEPIARARLMLLAGELHLLADHVEDAERAWTEAKAVEGVPDEVRAAADRKLESLMSEGDRDLRRQKAGLLRLLEGEEQATERLHLLGRLREIGRALDDEELSARSTDEQLTIAAQLARSREHRDVALAALHDLVAETARYEQVVEILEDIAKQAESPEQAARLLSDAARLVWHGLRNAGWAVDLLRRAMARAPELPNALSLLGEIAEGCDDETLEGAIYRGLAPLVERPPPLAIKLAEIAQHLGRDDEAIAMLTEVIEAEIEPDVRLHALTQLDGLLAADARARERLPTLERLLEQTLATAPDRASDVAHELATLQRTLGANDQAAQTCATALARDPSHAPLARLHAELLEEAGEWSRLAETLVLIANLSLEEHEQARWLTRAARVHLDHPAPGTEPRESMATARRLLERARDVDSGATEPLVTLVPLAFAQGRWSEALRVAGELHGAEHDEPDVLILAALAEPLLKARWPLAQALGPRPEGEPRSRYLWPGLRRVVEEVATSGPLPRLDPILAAAAVLAGDGKRLFEELERWAAREPVSSGVALARARLREAHDDHDAARHLYQVGAFLAPEGPLPALVDRLPAASIPAGPLTARGWVPLEGRTAVHTVLIELRAVLVGVRGQGGAAEAPPDDRAREAVQLADAIVSRFRAPLGASLPVAWSRDPLAGGVGLRNDVEPTIVVGSDVLDLPRPEVEFRLAFAAGSIVNGLAILGDTHPASLVDVLDAMTGLVNAAHDPTTPAAQAIADALASRGVHAHLVPSRIREALAAELQHWLTSSRETSQLSHTLERANVLFATRLSARLDGALLAIARDTALTDGDAVLATPQARWLLRSLRLR